MPPKVNSLLEAPYLRGSLQHYVKGGQRDAFDWLPNDPFRATLQISGMKSGYSAKYVTLVSPAGDGREFPMFVVDLIDAVATLPVIRNGIMDGRWWVRKRGANYGLAIASMSD